MERYVWPIIKGRNFLKDGCKKGFGFSDFSPCETSQFQCLFSFTCDIMWHWKFSTSNKNTNKTRSTTLKHHKLPCPICHGRARFVNLFRSWDPRHRRHCCRKWHICTPRLCPHQVTQVTQVGHPGGSPVTKWVATNSQPANVTRGFTTSEVMWSL